MRRFSHTIGFAAFMVFNATGISLAALSDLRIPELPRNPEQTTAMIPDSIGLWVLVIAPNPTTDAPAKSEPAPTCHLPDQCSPQDLEPKSVDALDLFGPATETCSIMAVAVGSTDSKAPMAAVIYGGLDSSIPGPPACFLLMHTIAPDLGSTLGSFNISELAY